MHVGGHRKSFFVRLENQSKIGVNNHKKFEPVAFGVMWGTKSTLPGLNKVSSAITL